MTRIMTCLTTLVRSSLTHAIVDVGLETATDDNLELSAEIKCATENYMYENKEK